jgi:hypothetical protein
MVRSRSNHTPGQEAAAYARLRGGRTALAPASAARERTGQAFHPDDPRPNSTKPAGDRALPPAQFLFPASEAAGFARYAMRREPRRVPSTGGEPSAGGSIGVSQYGQTCQIGSSGAPQFVHACLSFVVQTGQTR